MKSLYTNAVIYSPDRLRGDCLAVDNGRITEIGPKSRLIGLKKHGYKVINLKGKTILPGFIDSHLHLLGTGYQLMEIDLDYIYSVDEVLAKIEKAAKKLFAGQWLLGRGWNKNLWGDDFPTKEMLDKVAPNNPVRLFAKDGHTLWVNSAALKACGIDDTTANPTGGEIMHHSDGSLYGIILENAVYMVTEKMPARTADYKMKAVKKASAYLNKLGITGVTDCDWYGKRLSLFKDARQKGDLNLRVFMMLSPDDINNAVKLGLTTGFGDDFLTAGALKLFMDGSLGSQTAWMHEAYENNNVNYGVPTLSEDELEMYFEKTHLNGISMAVHAIGDRANTELLDFFGKKYAVSRKLGLKHRIEHVQIIRREDIPKLKKYNVAASVQPIHVVSDRDMADRYWGKRARWAYPFATMLKRGAKVAFGSDCPIEDPNPMRGIYAAVARKRHGDDRGPWYAQECVTLKDAIRAYTETAADICTWSGRRGVLAAGYDADFVILSDDIYKVKTDDIPDIKVLATAVNGEIVYQDKAFKL